MRTQRVTYRPITQAWRDEPTVLDVDAFIPPELADGPIDLPSSVAEQVAAAERSLAALDADAQHIPGSILEAATFALLRAESVSSSRIEGLDVTNRRLAEALHDPVAAKRIAREVGDNTGALQRAVANVQIMRDQGSPRPRARSTSFPSGPVRSTRCGR